jgi:hypothetical protein
MFPDDFRARRSPTLNILAGLLTEGVQAGLFRDDDVWELAITTDDHRQAYRSVVTSPALTRSTTTRGAQDQTL